MVLARLDQLSQRGDLLLPNVIKAFGARDQQTDLNSGSRNVDLNGLGSSRCGPGQIRCPGLIRICPARADWLG